MTSGRRTGQLHRHRVSAPETVYFVTCCTQKRHGGLLWEVIAGRILKVIKASDRDGDTCTLGFTLMPDHCHWVFRQGSRLSLGRIVAKFKSLTKDALTNSGLAWQRDFFEHRLLPDEYPEEYALYTFLNPYRQGLIAAGSAWLWWWTAEPTTLRFLALANPNGSPPAEWIEEPVPKTVRHGE